MNTKNRSSSLWIPPDLLAAIDAHGDEIRSRPGRAALLRAFWGRCGARAGELGGAVGHGSALPLRAA